MSISRPRIGVVGTGMAGLSAACMLSEKAHDAVVIDRARGPGSRISTRRNEDLRLIMALTISLRGTLAFRSKSWLSGNADWCNGSWVEGAVLSGIAPAGQIIKAMT